MSDKDALPAKTRIPGGGGRGPDAEWPEDPSGTQGRGQGTGYDAYDPLQSEDLFEGVLFRRVVAYILDGIALGVLWLLGWLLLSGLTAVTFGLASPLMILLFVLPLLYHSLTIAGFAATPGMRLLDIEVRLLNGQRPDLAHAVLLTILFYATVWLTASLILLIALFNRRGRCLHDFLTGTLVVRRSSFRERRI